MSQPGIHRRTKPKLLLATFILLAALSIFLPSSPGPHAATLETAFPLAAAAGPEGFALRFKNLVVTHEVFSAFVLPGHDLLFEVLASEAAGAFTVQSKTGELESTGPRSWHWQAPDHPMLTELTVSSSSGESRRLNLFVLTPYDGEDSLNGFKIGRYRDPPLKGLPAYRRPAGFIEVRQDQVDLAVSPHFRLGQFLCKQDSHFPKYLALQETLLLKLEALLSVARERGMDIDTFEVMSGYRTPSYNRAIGNETTYSRHSYGDAADIFIDRDRDGRMDDLTGDGRVSLADAELLLELAREVEQRSGEGELVGGLGLYGPKKHRGPFLHVDARGFEASWVSR